MSTADPGLVEMGGTDRGGPPSQSTWSAGKHEINPESKSLQNCKRRAERNAGIEQPLESEWLLVLPENKREEAREPTTGGNLHPIRGPGRA